MNKTSKLNSHITAHRRQIWKPPHVNLTSRAETEIDLNNSTQQKGKIRESTSCYSPGLDIFQLATELEVEEQEAGGDGGASGELSGDF